MCKYTSYISLVYSWRLSQKIILTKFEIIYSAARPVTRRLSICDSSTSLSCFTNIIFIARYIFVFRLQTITWFVSKKNFFKLLLHYVVVITKFHWLASIRVYCEFKSKFGQKKISDVLMWRLTTLLNNTKVDW